MKNRLFMLPVVLGMFLMVTTGMVRAADTTETALVSDMVRKINELDLIAHSNRDILNQKILYEPALRVFYVMNQGAKSIDIIDASPDADPQKTVQIDLSSYPGKPKCIAYGAGVLAVLMDTTGAPDRMVCFGKDGRFLKTFDLDSTMQGISFNPYSEQFVIFSMGNKGYCLYTINMKGGPAYLATAKVNKTSYINDDHTETAAEKMLRVDPYGVEMMIIAMMVVFSALIFLYLTFKYVAKIYTMDIRKRFLKKKGAEMQAEQLPGIHDTTNELGAAIGLALYFYKNQLHDHENTVLTIRKAAKMYSPWSSKIYGIIKSLK